MSARRKLPPVVLWRRAVTAASGQMTSSVFRVAIALQEHASPDGSEAFPSTETLMREAGGLGRRTVQIALDRLVNHGWLCVTEPGGGSGNTTHYALEIPSERAQTECAFTRGERASSGLRPLDGRKGRKVEPERAQILSQRAQIRTGKGARASAPEVEEVENQVEQQAFYPRVEAPYTSGDEGDEIRAAYDEPRPSFQSDDGSERIRAVDDGRQEGLQPIGASMDEWLRDLERRRKVA